MLNSEHMAPYPEWMEHVPYPPSYQIPNFFRFNAGDDALAYFVYFQQECGVRAAIEALCCKLFRYSLMGRTPIWYDYFAWGSIPIRELWCFLQELGALKDGIFQIMNGVTPMMIGTSNLNKTRPMVLILLQSQGMWGVQHLTAGPLKLMNFLKVESSLIMADGSDF